MRLQLFHAPLSCSLASRLALTAAGVPFELTVVSTLKGENRAPGYLAINPLGKVPALRVDDAVLTESTAILPFVADLAPQSGLMPTDPLRRAQAQSMLSYLSSSLHAAWTGVLRPERFTLDADVGAVREAALGRLKDALGHLEAGLSEHPELLGAGTVCDLYLCVFLVWRGAVPGLSERLPDTPGLDAVQARVFAKPALGAVLQDDLALRSAA